MPHSPRKDQQQVLAARWPELHEITNGGQVPPGGTVDLTDLWKRLHAPGASRELPKLLAKQAGGVANRLLAGLQSLHHRRDGNTDTYVEVDGDRITVTAWSTGGYWSSRTWWLQIVIVVYQSPDLGVSMSSHDVLFMVADKDGQTTYLDRSGVLGREITRWYMGLEARQQIRALLAGPDVRKFLADMPDPDIKPPALTDARVWGVHARFPNHAGAWPQDAARAWQEAARRAGLEAEIHIRPAPETVDGWADWEVAKATVGGRVYNVTGYDGHAYVLPSRHPGA